MILERVPPRLPDLHHVQARRHLKHLHGHLEDAFVGGGPPLHLDLHIQTGAAAEAQAEAGTQRSKRRLRAAYAVLREPGALLQTMEFKPD